jgi:hypothetical protein
MYRSRRELLQYPPPVKAMQLWADWNHGINQWAESHRTESEESSFRYLSLHIEDLVDESRDVRYRAMKSIAEFVGSGDPLPDRLSPLPPLAQISTMTRSVASQLKDQSSWAPTIGSANLDSLSDSLPLPPPLIRKGRLEQMLRAH